jgi:hypothetical protein
MDGNTELYRRTSNSPPVVRPGRADLERLNGSEIQVWEGVAVVSACRSPFLRVRLENWIGASRSAGGVPLLKDLYGAEEEARLDESMLLMQQGNDFVYVHQGKTSVQEYGKIFRGVLLSSIPGSMSLSFLDHYNAALCNMRPMYMQFRTDFSARHARWERIALPLVSDPQKTTKFLLLYSESMDDKLDILQAAFDRSSIGMIAAAKAIGEGRSLDEAEILLINARAKSMLKIPDEESKLNCVRDLRDWVKNIRKWTLLSEPKTTSGRTIILYRDKQSEKNVTVVIEPIERFVIFHIID